MLFRTGHEVYVLLEDVFELDQDVDADNACAVRIRTRSGLRISLPIEYVAGWDVHTAVRDVSPRTVSAGTRRQPLRRAR
jgi:hypothetical protein